MKKGPSFTIMVGNFWVTRTPFGAFHGSPHLTKDKSRRVLFCRESDAIRKAETLEYVLKCWEEFSTQKPTPFTRYNLDGTITHGIKDNAEENKWYIKELKKFAGKIRIVKII